eukprot:477373_1
MSSEMKQTLTITKIVEKFDLSGVDWDKYPKGKRIKSKFVDVDDVRISVNIFPDGTTKAEVGYSSIFVKILEPGKDIMRKLHIVFKCEDKHFSELNVNHAIQRWTATSAKSVGANEAFKSNIIKSTPYITATFTLNHDPSFVPLKSCKSFPQQLNKMHKFSRVEGDITLIVKLNQNEDELYVPAAKKKKPNDENKNQNSTDETIKVSSIILKSASKVFERMLSSNNNMIEYQEKKIVVHAQNVKDVKNMIYFMCTNELKHDCNALAIIQLAHYYEINRLYWECVN